MRWLKAELHSHCDLDPVDYRICNYSAEDLIREAARLEYEILAITCHNLDVWSPALDEFAAFHGVTLVPAMEVVTRDQKHVLVYNFRTGSDQLNTLAKISAQKKPDTLVVAPHAYYPARSCLRRQLENNVDLFDAVEWSGFFTARLDFNRRARHIAEKHGKPVIGASDAHQLWQLGRTFTRVLADPEVPSILAAIRAGRVKVKAEPLSFGEVLSWWGSSFWRAVTNARAHPARLRSARQASTRHGEA